MSTKFILRIAVLLFFAAAGLASCDGLDNNAKRARMAASSTVNYALLEKDYFDITYVSEPDSVLGDILVDQDEVDIIMGNLKDVAGAIVRRTDNFSKVSDNDIYFVAMANLQIEANNNLRQLSCEPTHTDDFTGWKVRVFFEKPIEGGDTIRVMRICYLTPDGYSVVKSFDFPML